MIKKGIELSVIVLFLMTVITSCSKDEDLFRGFNTDKNTSSEGDDDNDDDSYMLCPRCHGAGVIGKHDNSTSGSGKLEWCDICRKSVVMDGHYHVTCPECDGDCYVQL